MQIFRYSSELNKCKLKTIYINVVEIFSEVGCQGRYVKIFENNTICSSFLTLK